MTDPRTFQVKVQLMGNPPSVLITIPPKFDCFYCGKPYELDEYFLTHRYLQLCDECFVSWRSLQPCVSFFS